MNYFNIVKNFDLLLKYFMDMRIDVTVKSGKNESKVIKKDFAVYEVWVRSRPVDGAANRELIKVLAEYFSVNKNCLRIARGLTIPVKVVELSK